MKIPQIAILTGSDNEDKLLDALNRLSGMELLELQQFADKITELVLIIHLARSEYGIVKGENNE
jgi:hypothetical protein